MTLPWPGSPLPSSLAQRRHSCAKGRATTGLMLTRTALPPRHAGEPARISCCRAAATAQPHWSSRVEAVAHAAFMSYPCVRRRSSRRCLHYVHRAAAIKHRTRRRLHGRGQEAARWRCTLARSRSHFDEGPHAGVSISPSAAAQIPTAPLP